MEATTIGRRIMKLRKDKGLTQDQLAEKVGVSAQAVSKWENDISCPDISILPQLSDVLGVSTDELLGVKPIEPHVVVIDSKGEKESKIQGSGNYTFDFNAGKSGITLAIMLVVVGVAFLLSKLNVLPLTATLTFWGIVWPAVILALGVAWSIKHVSPFPIGIALLGLYYLLFNLGATEFVLTWSVVWPILLILVGLSAVQDILTKKKHKKHSFAFEAGDDHTPVTEYSEDDGYIKYDCAFVEDHRVVSADVFRGADIDLSFGKCILDLTKCKHFAPDSVLKIDVSFGSHEIILPRTVRISSNNLDRSFGSITIRGEANADAAENLRIKGDASFGSLVIRYA